MNKKLVRDYLVITFLLMLIGFGGTTLLCRIFNISLEMGNKEMIFIYPLYVLGSFSPTLASYIALKNNNKVSSIKEWLINIFKFKDNSLAYIFAILFVIIFYFINCLMCGYVTNIPFIASLINVPLMILGGGNEEVGWRMILVPELEKKYGFILTAFIVGIIWSLWHSILFLIPGNNEIFYNFIIECIIFSFALSTIKRLSNGIMPCILFHCMINAFNGTFTYNSNYLSLLVCFITIFISSVILINIFGGRLAEYKYYDMDDVIK